MMFCFSFFLDLILYVFHLEIFGGWNWLVQEMITISFIYFNILCFWNSLGLIIHKVNFGYSWSFISAGLPKLIYERQKHLYKT